MNWLNANILMLRIRRDGKWAVAPVLGMFVVVSGLMLLAIAPINIFVSSALAAQPAVAGQTATLLPNGTTLLAGGLVNGRPSDSLSLLNTATGTQTALSVRMRVARREHSATVLPDGRVLIVGGFDAGGRVVREVEMFEPSASTMDFVPNAAISPRAGHAAALLTDGQLLLVGGRGLDGSLAGNAERWDYRRNQQVVLEPSATLLRSGMSARLLVDGSVLFSGGADVNRNPVGNALLYTPGSTQFQEISNTDAQQMLQAVDQAALPQVVESIPASGATGIATNSVLSIRFAGPVDVASVHDRNLVLHGPQGQEQAKVIAAQDGMLAFLTPVRELIPGTRYTVLVDGVVGRTGAKISLQAIEFTTAGPGAAGQSNGNSSSSAATGNAGASNTARSATVSTTSLDSDDNEVFVPRAENRGGRWRTGRAYPEVVHAQLDRDTRTRDRIKARRLRAPGGEARVVSAAPSPVLTATTGAVSGLVLRLSDAPLANVTVTAGNRSARTDAEGRFSISGLAPGQYELFVDGSTASQPGREYAQFVFGIHIQAGVHTEFSHPLYLPRVRERDWFTIGAPVRSNTVITHPDMPGLEIHIPRGTVIRDRAGRVLTRIAIVPLPLDRSPFPTPANFPMYFMAHPGGAVIQGLDPRTSPGVRIIYPNYTNDAPGTQHHFWMYDSRGRGWVVYGNAHVSADGHQIIPDPGVALHEHMSAGHSLPGSNAGPECTGDQCSCPTGGTGASGGTGSGGSGGGSGGDASPMAGDPVHCGSGFFYHLATDLFLNDIIPISMTRTYRPGDTVVRPFGKGSFHNYYMLLSGVGGFPQQDLELALPSGKRIKYTHTSGTNLHTDYVYETLASPGEFDGSKITSPNVPGLGEVWRLTLRNGMNYDFGAYDGKIRRIFDRYGNLLELTYNYSGNIARITSPNGRYLDFTYDINNRISQLKDIAGRIWTYSYTDDHNLERVTYPDNTYEQYTYDTAGRMLTVRDRRGNTMVTNVYDGNGRVQQQTLADNGIYTFAYTTGTDGKITRTDVTNPNGVVRRLNFNADGNVTSAINALGRPEQRTTTREYDTATKRLTAKVDALGRRTEYGYDTKGNVTTVKTMAGTVAEASWSATYESTFSQIMTVTNPNNKIYTAVRDNLARLTKVTDPLSRTLVELTYNAAGQPLTVKNGAGKITTYTYDLGDLVSIVDPLGRATTLFPDLLGRTFSTTDTAGRVTLFEHNALDQLVSVIDPLNQETRLTYNANGSLETVTAPNNGITNYTYDSKNRLAVLTNPLNKVERFEYDGNNNLTQYTDRNNKVTTHVYDALDRRVQSDFGRPNATGTPESTVTYAYDAENRLTQVTDTASSGPITRTYNDLTRTNTEITPQGSVSYSFDAVRRRISMTVAGQSPVSYGYDDANKLISITQDTASVGFTYDESDRRATLTLPNGIVATYGYDDASQLTSITYQQGATTLGDLNYTYDLTGNRNQATGTLASTNLPVASSNNSFNAANQLTLSNGVLISYDDNGNMLSDGNSSFSWDARNRLVSLSGPASGSFQYDALGRRTSKSINGTSTSYLYDGANPVQELDGTTPTANLLTGLNIDEFFRRTDSNGSRDYLTDALGTVLALTDSTGLIQTRYTYDPYGNTTVTGEASSNPFQYTGRENDGTGLYYYRARYYSPGMGRFITSDPIGLGGGLNTYAYVGNNPLRYVDPLGLLRWPGDIEDDAISDTISKFPNRRDRWNGPGDAYRHCLASCMMTRENGKAASEFLGWANEKYGDWFHNQNPKERAMDEWNNSCGNKLGGSAGSDQDCKNRCMNELKNGGLKYYDGGRLPGDGYWY